MPDTTTVDKALEVLFHLTASRSPLGVTTLGRELGMPKSSVHRLLKSLSNKSLVQRDERGRYKPGVGLLTLSAGFIAQEPLLRIARPLMQETAEQTGETCFLVASRHRKIWVLDKVEGSGFLRASPPLGSTVPVYATAVGKLYAAFGADEIELEPCRDAAFEPFTAATLRDQGSFAAEIELVREQRFAKNRDEWITGLSVVAAPVFFRQRMAAALALAAATPRMDSLGEAMVAATLIKAADRVAQALTGS